MTRDVHPDMTKPRTSDDPRVFESLSILSLRAVYPKIPILFLQLIRCHADFHLAQYPSIYSMPGALLTAGITAANTNDKIPAPQKPDVGQGCQVGSKRGDFW